MPEQNLAAIKNFYLAKFGFSINLKTIRNVYLVGDTFEVTAKTTDAEGSEERCWVDRAG